MSICSTTKKRRRRNAVHRLDWWDERRCCCQTGTPTTCCEDALPAPLFATITAIGCEIDGQVVTLSFDGFDGALYNFSGTFSASCGTITLEVSLIQTTCRMAFGLKIGGDTCVSGAGDGSPVPCPFTTYSMTGNWLNPPCGCCSNGTGITVEVAA